MNPLVLAVTAVFFLIAGWWILRKNRLDLEGIRRFSERKGWGFEHQQEGNQQIVHLSPPNQAWLLEIRNHSERSPAATFWISEEPALEDGILSVRAGPPLPQAATGLGVRFMQTILQRAMIQMCGEDPGTHEWHTPAVGEPVFDATHTVIVSHPELGKRWVTKEIQALLQGWPKGLEVPDLVLWEKGLRLGLQGSYREDHLDALVQLGEQLQEGLRQVK